MKSLKITLVLIFALLLCSSCVGNGENDTATDTNRPESGETAPESRTESDTGSGTDTTAESDTDPINDGTGETGSESDTDTELSERTRRMRARTREQVEHWIHQVQSTADAYLR